MKVDGACLCGQITYKAEIDPDLVAVCHCSDCQVNSGSAYGVVAGVIEQRFQLLSGTLQEFEKIAESGRTRTLTFCPKCGTRIYACTKEDPSAFFGLRIGSINQRAKLTPKRQVWCNSALPWVSDLSDLVSYSTNRTRD
ncbi:MAG: GFA family protein [Pseudomonadota bacterium]